MKLIIDRFEEDVAVCETDDGAHIEIERERLPDDAREGDVIEECDGIFTVSVDETNARRSYIRNLLKGLIKE